MEGILIHVAPYTSRHGSRCYKGILKVRDHTGDITDWSIQVYPAMKNYKHWDAIITDKLAYPSKWIELDNLVALSKSKKTLNADYKPTYKGMLDKIQTEEEQKQDKFNDLFKFDD